MNPYTVEVSHHLADLRRQDREAALADLDELLASGVSPAEIGPADEYAAALCEQFVPRSFGLAWWLNVGNPALSLRLRPDDARADVVAAIPRDVRRAQRLAPIALAAGTALAAGVLSRTGERVPVNLDLSGRVNCWADRRWLWILVAGTGAIAGWGAERTDGQDAVARPALATSGAALALTATCIAVAASRAPKSPRLWVWPVAALVPVLAELVATVVPLHAGFVQMIKKSRR